MHTELAAPDLWADIRRLSQAGAGSLGDPGADEDLPLSDQAVENVSRSVAELRKLLAKSKDIPSAERPGAERVLEQVEKASQRREGNGIRVSLAALKTMVLAAIWSEFIKKTISEPTVRWIIAHLAAAFGSAYATLAEIAKQHLLK